MVWKQKNKSVDTLLYLDGDTYFLDKKGEYMVKFCVTKIEPAPEKPHGLDYSLTLHKNGERIVGFDNAHPVRKSSGPGGKRKKYQDHRHTIKTVRPYEFIDAETLLGDFWKAVDRIMKKEGI